jgi:hypothetical protein
MVWVVGVEIHSISGLLCSVSFIFGEREKELKPINIHVQLVVIGLNANVNHTTIYGYGDGV